MSGIISSATVYKEYDYSNAIPTVNDVFQIVKLCDYIDSFISAYKNGSLKKVNEVTITLNLYFYRGKGGQEVEHENSFVISFKPYNIKFIRQSNHEDSNMDQIEKQFDAILSEMAVANSIFCDKSNI